jgi:oxalate decarboxylase/phosphoglucose isomerase-like protein (cupin superfamily)
MMTDGLLLAAGSGPRIQNMHLLVGADQGAAFSAFEAVVQPGFDVGAHWHDEAQEMFYVIDGELDLLAFEPVGPAGPDWRRWTSKTGQTVFRGGPGSFMYVPAGCPHAFFNPGQTSVRMLFCVAPSGHETYLRELGDLLSTGAPPDPPAIEALRLRYDIHQLTPLLNRPAE